MRLLLDTHSLLWFIGGDANLPESARSLIEDPANQSFVSVASLWEMAIKVSLGRLTLKSSFETLVPHQLQQNGFGLLPITVAHLASVISLPFHHRDPFDRLLIAQATVEQMALVSRDGAFEAYDVNRLW